MKPLVAAGVALGILTVVGTLIWMSGRSSDSDTPRPVGVASRADTEGPPRAELSLPQGDAALRIVLRRPDGGSLGGLSISLLAGRSAGRIETDSDGVAKFDGIAPGVYTVRVAGDKLPLLESTTTVEVARGEKKEVEFAIGPFDLSISGRVLDQDGEPIGHIVVVADRGLASPAEGTLLRVDEPRLHAVSAEDGTYFVDGLEAVEYVLQTQATDIFPPVRQTFHAGSTSADLYLAGSKASTISGRVYDTEGKPVSGETVHLYAPSLEARHQSATKADGSFLIEDVRSAGDYEVWIHPRRTYGDWKRSGFVVQAEDLELEIELEVLPTGTVRGRMVDAGGAPVPGFQFTLHSMSAASRGIDVTSDASGEFVVEEAPTGELVFETGSQPRFIVKGWLLKPEAVLDVELLLDWGIDALSGTVVDPDGNPVPSAEVELLWSRKELRVRSTSSRSTLTDAAGRFSFSGLGAGVHRIRAIASGFRTTQLVHETGRGDPEPVVKLRPPLPEGTLPGPRSDP